MNKYYLAIDIGASSGRHIVAYMQDGILQLEEIYRFPNLPDKKNGALTWDTGRLFFHVLEGLKKAKELNKIPVSVGIDTWAVDYALLDENDQLLDPMFCYRDSRTEATVPLVHEKISFDELYAKTGMQFQPFNTIYQLFDDQLSGKMAKAKSMLMLPDYLNFLLTGVKKQEYTNATSTGMVNAKTHTWDEEIIQRLNYNPALFQELTQPTSEVGMFSKEVQNLVGYNAKVVLPATHDTASAVLSALVDEKKAYISSGTWSLLGAEIQTAKTDKQSQSFNYTNEGSIHYGFRYQKNIMGLWMIQQVRHELNDAYSFQQLADMARAEGQTDCVVDVSDNRFLAPLNMTAEIESAVGKKLTVAQMAYCIYNSLAIGYQKAVQELEQATGKTFDAINIIGGGCKNELLNELTAKHTGKRVLAGPVEATAIGNLLVQLMADGVITSLDEGRKIVKKSFDCKEISL